MRLYASKTTATTVGEFPFPPHGGSPPAGVSIDINAAAVSRVFLVTFTAKVVDINGGAYARFVGSAEPCINGLDARVEFELTADNETRSASVCVIVDPTVSPTFAAGIGFSSDVVGAVADLQVTAVEIG